VRFTYSPTAQVRPGACTPQYCLKKGMWLVSTLESEADTQGLDPQSADVLIQGRRFDVRGRGWLGFDERTMTDLVTGTRVTTSFDNISPRTSGPAYVYLGAKRPTKEVLVLDDRPAPDSPGTMRRVTTTYEYQEDVSMPVARSVLKAVRTQEDEGTVSVTFGPSGPVTLAGPSHAVRARKDTYETDAFGLVTSHTSEVFAGGFDSSGGIAPGVQVIKSEMSRNATPDLPGWLIRRFGRITRKSTEPARPGHAQQEKTRTLAVTWVPGTTCRRTSPTQATSTAISSASRKA
jgi:hypothetical protein